MIIKSQSKDVIGDEIKQFSMNMQLLREFVGVVKPVLNDHSKKIIQTNSTILDSFMANLEQAIESKSSKSKKVPTKKFDRNSGIKLTNAGDGKITVELNNQPNSKELNKIVKSLILSTRIPNHLYEISLISLISNVELFISKVLHVNFQMYPKAVTEKTEKQFSYEDLASFDSIDDAKSHLITKEIDKILREGFKDWINYFDKKLKLKMPFIKSNLEKVYEYFLRRNLLVHNGGKVNSVYSNSLLDKSTSKVKIGEKLNVTEEYLEEAINSCELAFILLAAELRSKGSLDKETEFTVINNIAFEHLENEKYAIAEGLCEYLYKNNACGQANQWVARINYWQSLKWQNRISEVKEEIIKADLSGMKEVFELSRYILLDDYKAFFKILPRALANKDLTKKDLETWPLFRLLRETDQYKNFMKAEFEEKVTKLPQKTQIKDSNLSKEKSKK